MRKLFWSAFGFDVAAILYLVAMMYWSGSPWADLGICALLVPLMGLPALGFGFEIYKEQNARVLCLLMVTMGAAVLAVPVVMVVTEQTKQSAVTPASGLSAALGRGDVAAVKTLLPEAGDLNRFYGEATRYLAGLEVGGGNRRAMVEALLSAGAEVNYAEGDAPPVWWAWIRRDGSRMEDVEMVRLMLERGVDVKKQARGEGPVAVAIRRECWETAVLLLEAGAEWQGESAKRVRYAVDMLAYGHQDVPEALGNLKVMIDEPR